MDLNNSKRRDRSTTGEISSPNLDSEGPSVDPEISVDSSTADSTRNADDTNRCLEYTGSSAADTSNYATGDQPAGSDSSFTITKSQMCSVESQTFDPTTESSLEKQNSLCDKPDSAEEIPDAVILCNENSRKQAGRLLNNLAKHFKIRFAEDIAQSGATEIKNLDDLLEIVPCVLLLIDENFVSDSTCVFQSHVALSSSVVHVENCNKKEFVIPVFTQRKRDIPGLRPTLKAMAGIEYLNENWSSSTEEKFRQEIKKCLQKRQDKEDVLDD